MPLEFDAVLVVVVMLSALLLSLRDISAVSSLLDLAVSDPLDFLRLPPRILCTKMHSMPNILQFEQTPACFELFPSSADTSCSPSHLIFLSRHARHALLATFRLACWTFKLGWSCFSSFIYFNVGL